MLPVCFGRVRGVGGPVGLGQRLLGFGDGLALAFQLGAGSFGPLPLGAFLLGLTLLGPAALPLGAAHPAPAGGWLGVAGRGAGLGLGLGAGLGLGLGLGLGRRSERHCYER